jgi:hypothetical protein
MSTTLQQDHSLSWTLARAADRLRTYRLLLAANIILDILIGLAALVCPAWLARLLAQPEPFPDAWLQAFGLTLIGTSLLYVSGWSNPTFYRWPNWAGILIRLALALLFLGQGQGFLPPAVWEAFWGIALLVAYYRLVQADLLWRP